MTSLPTPAEVRALFSTEELWQACLDVEAAMALEQGALGMIPARSAIDHITEYVLQLALCGTSIGRMVNELYLLMSDEYGEVAEILGADVVGSSTMPHKVNPKLSVRILAQASQLRAQVGVAFDAMQPSNESDHATNLLTYASMQDPVILAYESERRSSSTPERS